MDNVKIAITAIARLTEQELDILCNCLYHTNAYPNLNELYEAIRYGHFLYIEPNEIFNDHLLLKEN